MHKDYLDHISGNKCGTCGGDAPNWKCPKCGGVSDIFDPSHRQKCRFGAKYQAQCQKCGEAEEKCICEPVS
ncbi:MAG: hypothetical protein A3I86_02630 [Candidatus Zambryskibacteria bacterium RIFCSPLOWO2_02_FULL_39_14]|uniref:Uncharacterized protein n=1 Tax=Candidatus Zambryskibacteria bacterium RIFCSPLOWO2_02_FULL_39_14 TaxID=1802769 RepID=A0A1G2UGL2_9BACT|nr:MAG: hypothetical protein A3I86_02630 [Candidatus Zambryskibacteria bacterium RIFCSPLOWO2_02_FULL_39_14]